MRNHEVLPPATGFYYVQASNNPQEKLKPIKKKPEFQNCLYLVTEEKYSIDSSGEPHLKRVLGKIIVRKEGKESTKKTFKSTSIERMLSRVNKWLEEDSS